MNILVTGGAGYIGSHTALSLLDNGFDVVIADNFSNSKPEVIERMKQIASKSFEFVRCELKDAGQTENLFKNYDIHAVIHFAGYKAVGQSVSEPLMYFDNNINTTINLLNSMIKHDVKRFVFSSSATVYGNPHAVPIDESFPLAVTNPYGRTKLIIEDMLRDLSVARPDLKIALLRYFNPIGAHSSGLIGEDPCDIPNNLLPYVSQVAVGKLNELSVFGDDYPTRDGTGVRDYIHVVDLALGHIAALNKLEQGSGVYTYNLGTGKGSTVLEIVREYEKACGKKIPYRIAPRRAGDVAECYANPQKAKDELGWSAKYDLARMCEDSWRFMQSYL